MARLGAVGFGAARHGEVRQGKARGRMANEIQMRHGVAQRGVAGPGLAGFGEARGRMAKTEMIDPIAYFPRDASGKLRSGLYHRIKLHLVWKALLLGWIPVPPRIVCHCDEYVVWMTWIECACGRAMPVPR